MQLRNTNQPHYRKNTDDLELQVLVGVYDEVSEDMI